MTEKTPLLHGVLSNNAEIVRLLLMSGANPYIADSQGNSALHLAAAGGNTETVRLLLTAGIFVDARNLAGQSAYDLSFKNQQYGEQIRQVLVSAGATVPLDPAQASRAAPSSAGPTGLSSSAAASSAGPSGSADAPAAPSAPSSSASQPQVPAASSQAPVSLPYAVRFSWPRINPSRARGWNNSDKITDQAALSLVYTDGGTLLSETVTIPLKGVNADAFYLDRRILMESGRNVTGTVSIRTRMGGTLTGRITSRSGEDGTLDLSFESFQYSR